MSYAEKLFDLSGQVVLITGGSRGLGREMAFGVARCGADVVIASRKMENCVSTAEEIERETGRTAMPYEVHVGRWINSMDSWTRPVKGSARLTR